MLPAEAGYPTSHLTPASRPSTLTSPSNNATLSCQATFVDIYYRDLISDTIAVIQKLYEVLGVELRGHVKERMQSYLVEKPQNKQGKHKYSLEQFGLNRKEVGERFNEYIKRFDVGVK